MKSLKIYITLFKASISIKILAHICCWVIFITYEILTVVYTANKLGSFSIYVIFYGLNITYFYFNAYLLSRYLTRKKPAFIKGACILLLVFLAFLTIKAMIDFIMSKRSDESWYHIKFREIYLLGNIFRSVYFFMLSAFYWLAGYIVYYRRQAVIIEKRQLIVQRDKAELEVRLAKSNNAFLKQQINPHLFFNTLNFIYEKYFMISEEASDVILLLSEILRFSLVETPEEKILLSSEIKQLEYFYQINKYRYNGQIFLKIMLAGNFEDFTIIPLILLTLCMLWRC